MSNFNRFAYVYSLIKNRHPNWVHNQVRHCTAYALKKHFKRYKYE